ncbi:S-protein homolog 1-like [Alnus glutinosa]|uniref:S-protein homolog 1-like n=1 Tax=Alnus glutinosa TaxID=3517 RepID=UPI002D77FEEE|nr:S-protein homolog 1-like [Alnus glutinosa]
MSPSLLLVLALCMSTGALICNSAMNKFSVHVMNGFKNQTLQTHCQSKDDDLGLQLVPVNGEFQWHFRVNYFGTTLYFCNMWWVGGHRSFNVFWVNDDFLVKDCGNSDCRWKAQEDGIYLYNSEHNEYHFYYNWEP